MRSALLLAGPVAVSAQVLSTITGRVQTATISSGSEVLYTTTWTYSNPATNYLSLTDSEGVVTGMPSNTANTLPAGQQPEVVTSQPPVATIPAGLPTGETQILYNGTAGFTSFTVSVGSSTTVVLGGTNGVGASVTSGGSSSSQTGSGSGGSGSGSNSGSNSGNSNSNSDSGSASGSASASASESGNAASSVRVAGAGIGLFAFIAALL